MLKSYATIITILIWITMPNLVWAGDCAQSNHIQNSGSRQRLRKEVDDIPSQSEKKRLEAPSEPGIQQPKKRCCGYDFDSKICKVVDNRVLCGFNKNVGWPKSKDHEVLLGDGCRIKGGRLECGYLNGPYTNPRRPPPRNSHEVVRHSGEDTHVKENNGRDTSVKENNVKDTHVPDTHVPDTHVPDTYASETHVKEQHEVINDDTMIRLKHTIPPNGQRVTKCLEIRDRIVCQFL